MKILVVSQYFWPENFRINDLSSELVNRGHEVTVLTGIPNYPDGVIYPDFEDSRHEFSGYQGVDVIRVPMLLRGKGSSIKLLMNYLSYALSASTVGIFKLRKRKFDVIFVFEPSPITVGFPAIIMRALKKAPVIFWVLDLWPETLQAIGVVKSKFFLKLIGCLVSFIYKRCDLILGQSKSFIEGIGKYSKDKAKIKYFPSWSESIFEKIAYIDNVDEISKCHDYFKILFAGNIGDAQDFASILNAVELLKKWKVKVKFFIVGDGRMFDWVKTQIEERELHDLIVLMGRYPLASMPDFYASADALLVTLKRNEVFAMTIPGKVQSYLAAGKPILAMLDGEGARVINESKSGLVSSSGDFKGLAKQVLTMSQLNVAELDKMALNAKEYTDKEFDRNRLITKLEGLFTLTCNDFLIKKGRSE